MMGERHAGDFVDPLGQGLILIVNAGINVSLSNRCDRLEPGIDHTSRMAQHVLHCHRGRGRLQHEHCGSSARIARLDSDLHVGELRQILGDRIA